MTLLSMESFGIKFVTRTGRVCPMRWTRPMAWTCKAGFRQGSNTKTSEAVVKFKPTAPARNDSKKMVVGGSFRKSRRALALAVWDMSPVIVLDAMPCFGSSARSQAKVSANWLNTSTLVGTVASSSSSFCEIFFSSATKAVSLEVKRDAPQARIYTRLDILGLFFLARLGNVRLDGAS